jgi:hypothetical protein
MTALVENSKIPDDRPARFRKKRYRTRWLLLLIFFIGYIATFSIFEDYALEYFVLTVVSCFVCSLLLSRLNHSLQVTFPFWLIFVVFLVAYYFKFYWLAICPEKGAIMWPQFPSLFFHPDSLIAAYSITTYGFGAFCVTSWFLLGKPYYLKIKKISYQITSNNRYRFVSSLVLLIVPFLMVITSFIMYKTGISVSGAESVYLPFRLAGIIYYTRTILIPALLLLLIWCSEQVGWYKKSMIGLILLFLHGFTQTILTTTKAGILSILILAFLLFLLTGFKIRKGHIWFFGGSLLMGIFLFSVAAEYRLARISGVGSLISMLSIATESIQHWFLNFGDILSYAFSTIFLRFTGVEMLMVYTGLDIKPLAQHAWKVIAAPGGLSTYVTLDIFGYLSHAKNSVAPGMVGWFYLVGGTSLVIFGLVGFTIVTHLLWKILTRMKLRSLPVARVLFLSLLQMIAMDGVLEGLISLPMLVYPASIAVCEWLMRARGRHRPLKMPAETGISDMVVDH